DLAWLFSASDTHPSISGWASLKREVDLIEAPDERTREDAPFRRPSSFASGSRKGLILPLSARRLRDRASAPCACGHRPPAYEWQRRTRAAPCRPHARRAGRRPTRLFSAALCSASPATQGRAPPLTLPTTAGHRRSRSRHPPLPARKSRHLQSQSCLLALA